LGQSHGNAYVAQALQNVFCDLPFIALVYRKRQGHGKVGSGAFLGIHQNLAMHSLHQLSAECQPKPGSAIEAGGVSIGLGKR